MRRGLSLVELLVAMSLVAILAAVAWPPLRAGMARAKSAKCLSHLRGLGIGLQLYLADHNLVFPELAAARASAEEEEPVIDTVLRPYVEDPRYFSCPADPNLHRETGTSYFWNSALNGQASAALNFFGLVHDPHRIPVMVDKESWHRHARHKVNHLFADGHTSKHLRLFAE